MWDLKGIRTNEFLISDVCAFLFSHHTQCYPACDRKIQMLVRSCFVIAPNAILHANAQFRCLCVLLLPSHPMLSWIQTHNLSELALFCVMFFWHGFLHTNAGKETLSDVDIYMLSCLQIHNSRKNKRRFCHLTVAEGVGAMLVPQAREFSHTSSMHVPKNAG